jgi:hypothetical protein
MVLTSCATEVEPGTRWADVQYRFGAEGRPPELVFPKDPAKGASSMFFSHESHGKVLSTVRCIERPYMFPSYLQRALACDLENPHGKTACGDAPYHVRK